MPVKDSKEKVTTLPPEVHAEQGAGRAPLLTKFSKSHVRQSIFLVMANDRVVGGGFFTAGAHIQVVATEWRGGFWLCMTC